jgi:hypothetical protein
MYSEVVESGPRARCFVSRARSFLGVGLAEAVDEDVRVVALCEGVSCSGMKR